MRPLSLVLIRTLANLAAAMIGAGVWAAACLLAAQLIFYPAVIVGVATGVAARFTRTDQKSRFLTGLRAAITTGSILAGLGFAIVQLITSAYPIRVTGIWDPEVTPDQMIALKANWINDDRISDGKPSLLSADLGKPVPSLRADIPEVLWNEASEWWDSQSIEEQQKLMNGLRSVNMDRRLRATIMNSHYLYRSFLNEMNLPWLILSVLIAFILGSTGTIRRANLNANEFG